MIKIAFITTLKFDKVITRKKLMMLAESQNLWPLVTSFSHPMYEFQKLLRNDILSGHNPFFKEISPIVKKYFGKNIFNAVFKKRINNLEKNFPLKRIILLCDDVETQSEFNMVKTCGFTTIGIPRLKSAVSTPLSTHRLINKSDIVIKKNMPVNEFEAQLEKLWHTYFRSIT